MATMAPMVKGLVVSVTLIATLAPAASTAQPSPRARGETRAWMYLKALNQDNNVRLLERHCRDPQRETGCLPLSNRVRREIMAGFKGELRIVHRSWPGGQGVYWVLGPIRFGERFARYRYAWQAPDGCQGFGAFRFERRPGGGWGSVGGEGGVGCP